jgi:hypothetical protein
MEPDDSSTVEGTEHLTPTKNTLTALKSDVTLESAIKELVDNALDGWKRHSDRLDPLQIDITAETARGQSELIIRDNSGGVPRDEAAMMFGLGRTAKANVPGSIGTYGLGAKKALVNLGVPFTIASRHEDADVGWEYRITEEWFEDDEDWSVDVVRNEELEAGVTQIRIEDLAYDWDRETVASLKEDLGETYNLFMDDTLDGESYDIDIKVDGESVQPAGLPDYSYTPFDGMFPRRFEDIQINVPDMDEPVYLHVTVGLLRNKNPQVAGTDIYCQKRKVVSGDRGKVGGYGKGQDNLGTFNVHKERLKILVEFETAGDGQQLPWDTQKSSIDRHNDVMTEAYNWIRRTAQHYFDLDANAVPRAFLEPYDHKSRYAHDVRPVVHDYNNRHNVVKKHKPDKDIPQVNQVNLRVQAHEQLGFRCERDIEDWMMPAYRLQMETESGADYTSLPELNVKPIGLDYDPGFVDDVLQNLNRLAELHVEADVYYPDDLKRWQVFAYKAAVEAKTNRDTLDETAPPEDVPTQIDELPEEDSEPEETQSDGPGPDTSGAPTEEQEDTIKLTLHANESGQSTVRVLHIADKEDLAQTLGLDDNASVDDLAEQLERRFGLLLEMSAPAQ